MKIPRYSLDEIDDYLYEMVKKFDPTQMTQLKLSMIQNFVNCLDNANIRYYFEVTRNKIFLGISSIMPMEVALKMMPIGPLLRMKGRFPIMGKWYHNTNRTEGN